MVYVRGDRFRAYVGIECVYWTDSIKGMRDQCVRLLEYKFRGDVIVVADSLNVGWCKSVDASTVWDWRI